MDDVKGKRYIIRNENFGLLIYDSINYDIFALDRDAADVLISIKDCGLDNTKIKYNAEFDVDDFINTLTDMKLISSNNIDACFVDNPIPEKNILSAPIKIFLTITGQCNNRCKHCFGDFGNGAQLGMDQISSILKELKKIGVFQISITGGEPFAHKDILEILNLIKSEGFTSQITTNGTILNEEIISFLKNNKMFRFSVSLEGDEVYHDYIRGKGNYETVKNNIKKLIYNDVILGVNTVLTSGNIDNIDVFLNDLYNNGIENISISHIVPVGRAKNYKSLINNPMDNINKKKFQNVIDQVQKFALKTQKPQFVFGLTINPNGTLQGQNANIKDFIDIKRCGAASTILTIKANGDVIPCVFLDEYLKEIINCDQKMNIMETSIIDIWENSKAFNFVRNIEVSDDCGRCNLYKENNCSGGCPVVSKYFTGSFNGKDEFCYLGVKNGH